MSSILTNNSAMVALDTLRSINKDLSSVQSEISTGKKVSNAKDNASIWAISTVMSTDVESFKQISDSLNLGNSTVGVARAGAEAITANIQDIKELIVSSQEENKDRGKIQTDIDALVKQIGSTVSAAQFNGLNLLDGTSSTDVKILSSLDRGADQAVTAAFINVARVDLSTAAAADAADKVAADAGFIVASGDTPAASDVAKASGDAGFVSTAITTSVATSGTGVISFEAGTIAEGDTFGASVGGADYSVTAASGETLEDAIGRLAAAITTGAPANLASATVGVNGGTGAIELSITADGVGAVTVDESAIVSTSSVGQLAEDAAAVFTFSGGDIEVGDTFTVNGFTATAEADETINDIIGKLKTGIDALGTANLVVTTTDATDPASDDAVLTLTATGGAATASATVAAQNTATPAGGLGALGDIDVSTSEGAAAALTAIEGLLTSAIDAAAGFGSAQKRIENQTEFVATLVDSLTTGIGGLIDADLEAASAKLQALQVQQQLGTQALSIANQAPQSLLSLFR